VKIGIIIPARKVIDKVEREEVDILENSLKQRKYMTLLKYTLRLPFGI